MQLGYSDKQSICQATKEKNKCFADGKGVVFFNYISTEILNERTGFTEIKKYATFCVTYLDKALEQYSTRALLQKELGDSRDPNKANIEWTVISAEAEWSRHSHF